MALIEFKKIPVFGFAIKWLQDNNMDYGTHVAVIAVLLLYALFTASPTLLGTSFSFFFNLAPIWLPSMAFAIFYLRWDGYIGKKFALSNGRVTYRIRLPQDVLKSPEAMEYVLNQIWNKQTIDNLWQAYIDGKRPLPYGLEIVSIGGEVRFYVNLFRKKAPEAFIPTIYSQYPGVEVVEEPVDYAAEIPVGDPNWDVMSFHLNKAPSMHAPIKTYIDIGLDRMPKEEEKLDPLTPLLERLADVKPQERIYVQFLIQTFRTESFKQGNLYKLKETPNWNKDAQLLIDALLQRDPETKRTLSGWDFQQGFSVTSPGERSAVESIERNSGKVAYTTGIRILYLAKKGHFRGNLVNPILRTLAQWDKPGLATIGVRWRTDFNYNWFSDPFGDRVRQLKLQEHTEYKQRRFYPKGPSDNMNFFTTEELASIFHLPGRVALTPTLDRIPSTRSQAPSNLPVGEPPTV